MANFDDLIMDPVGGVTPNHPEQHTLIALLLKQLNTDKQDKSTIDELIRDVIGSTLVQGANVSISVNDETNQIIIAASGGGGGGSAAWGSIGGTLTSQVDLLNALNAKVSGFTDPNVDAIVFWDDSAGAYAALTPATGLGISGTTLTLGVVSQANIENPASTAVGGITGQRFQQALQAIGNIGTETTRGSLELATDAETVAGTSRVLATHPAGVKAAIAALVGAAPATLDTLKEFADALGNDANFSATIMGLLGQKATAVSANAGIWIGTQAAYNALGTKSNTVLYATSG